MGIVKYIMQWVGTWLIRKSVPDISLSCYVCGEVVFAIAAGGSTGATGLCVECKQAFDLTHSKPDGA